MIDYRHFDYVLVIQFVVNITLFEMAGADEIDRVIYEGMDEYN